MTWFTINHYLLNVLPCSPSHRALVWSGLAWGGGCRGGGAAWGSFRARAFQSPLCHLLTPPPPHLTSPPPRRPLLTLTWPRLRQQRPVTVPLPGVLTLHAYGFRNCYGSVIITYVDADCTASVGQYLKERKNAPGGVAH